MPVASMTGFARFEGETLDASYVWELRSVNGKGLEVRLRLPQGFEVIEGEVRKAISSRLVRGNLQVSLSVRGPDESGGGFSVNEAMLAELLRLSGELVQAGHATLPSADGLLALKGVIEVTENGVSPETLAARTRDVLHGLRAALDRLVEAREAEGSLLRGILEDRLSEIEELTDRAERDPARSADAIRARLRLQVEELLRSSLALDDTRLNQEAALIAARADIREELDRLTAHVAAGRDLLTAGGAIGRRLDFLSQEFNRESNTLCSKSNATSLTAIGLELKVVVDQLREQVQNIE